MLFVGLAEGSGLRILGPTEPSERISVFSFVIENHQPLEVVKAPDAGNIAFAAEILHRCRY